MSHYSFALPEYRSLGILALLILCLTSFTMLSGCGDSLPPKVSSAKKDLPTPEKVEKATKKDSTPTSSELKEGEKLSPEKPVLSPKDLIEQDIMMLASNGVDPFSIAMPIQAIEVKEEEVKVLSPYYQSLIWLSPLVTVKVIKVEKPVVNTGAGTYSGLPVSVSVEDPTIAMQDALSGIGVNGISYKKTAPMAILSLSGDQAGGSTLFVKKGSRLFMKGYAVVVEDITASTVRISTTQGRYKVSQTLSIQDIFGFSRSGGTGTTGANTTSDNSNANAPSSGGASPSTGTGNPKNVSSQDIDKIVKDLLN